MISLLKEGLSMKANDVYRKTFQFVWLKLALGGCAIVFSIVLGLILLGISALSKNDGVIGFSMMLWLGASAGAVGVTQYYIGYLLKAGHIAVVTHLVKTGNLPEDQFGYGKQIVKEKFATAAAYFAVDRLVAGAVRQINGTLNIVGSFLEKIPGMEAIVSLAKTFVSIALGNVDECCMAYTFYHEDQSSFQSAADGVVVYFQNWKTILKDALKTAVTAVVISGVAWFFLMFVIIGILGVLGVPGILGLVVALVLTVMIMMIVKSSIMDSYTMVCMVCSYLRVAPTTEITFDLYDKLCKLSSKFKSLLRKAEEAV